MRCGLGGNTREQIWKMLAELNKISFYQESLEKQKVRSKWITLGDSNPRFYRSIINRRRMKNGIKCLKNGLRNLK